MKKLLLFGCIAFGIFLLSNCSATKKAHASKSTYTADIQPLITTNCAPCHVPSKGGRMKALDTYEGAKEEADDMIARIQLHPGDKGYMPFKRPRLSDSTIAVFKKWKDDGLMQ
jgi:mono/diheme cytochrome c family protein